MFHSSTHCLLSLSLSLPPPCVPLGLTILAIRLPFFLPLFSRVHTWLLPPARAQDEMWGLAMHPHKAEFCSCAEDETLRVWDPVGRTIMAMAKLGGPARCCAYSPDGSMIAVGIGGKFAKHKMRMRSASPNHFPRIATSQSA